MREAKQPKRDEKKKRKGAARVALGITESDSESDPWLRSANLCFLEQGGPPLLWQEACPWSWVHGPLPVVP